MEIPLLLHPSTFELYRGKNRFPPPRFKHAITRWPENLLRIRVVMAVSICSPPHESFGCNLPRKDTDNFCQSVAKVAALILV